MQEIKQILTDILHNYQDMEGNYRDTQQYPTWNESGEIWSNLGPNHPNITQMHGGTIYCIAG